MEPEQKRCQAKSVSCGAQCILEDGHNRRPKGWTSEHHDWPKVYHKAITEGGGTVEWRD